MSMKNYSIEKIGADYVVKVDDQSVMKMGSRRRAAQLVVEAQELLEDVRPEPMESPLDGGEADTEKHGPDDGRTEPAEGAV